MLQYVLLQPYAKTASVTALYRLTTAQQKGMNMLRIYCSISIAVNYINQHKIQSTKVL